MFRELEDRTMDRIIQIMPADGWRALFVIESCNGEGTHEASLEAYPPAAWALVSRDGVTGVEGVEADSIAAGEAILKPLGDYGSFVAYIPRCEPGRPPGDGALPGRDRQAPAGKDAEEV
jgi:hypothetical protein